jgi:N utilization substance protein A
MIAQLLFTEGFVSIEDILGTELKELANIEGFDEDVATEIRERAKTYLIAREKDLDEEIASLGVSKETFKTVRGLTKEYICELAKNNIKTLDDLGDLSGDELIDILGKYGLNYRASNDIIMAARAHWFNKG